MKKTKKTFISLLLVSLVLLLQGCLPSDFSVTKLTTPKTTHEVVKDESNKYKFEVSLTADMTQKYEWYVYTTGNIDETGAKFRKGVFNKTYYWNYGYTTTSGDDFYVYLLLVKDGDMETCKAFPYLIHFDDSGLNLTEEKAFTLSGDKGLYKEVTENLTLTASY